MFAADDSVSLLPFAGAFGLFFVVWAAMMVGILALTVWWIVVLVDVVKIPEHQYRAAGTDKTTWILVVVLAGQIGALIWHFAKRNEVHAMAGVVPPPTATPPGWYPYPDGTMRWWDGARWTEHQPQ